MNPPWIFQKVRTTRFFFAGTPFISLILVGSLFLASAYKEKAVKNELSRPGGITPDHHIAVEKGLKFLVSKQNVSGSFGPSSARIAISALSCLSLMANGSTPNRGQYGLETWKGIKYLMRKVQEKPKGYITTNEDENSRMHGHGYATLALAQAYGMFGLDEREQKEYSLESLKDLLEEAVACIENAQSPDGGWNYWPENDGGHEGSVTVCQVQALRAAKNTGIRVNLKTIEKALDYLRRSQNKDGSFCYSLLDRSKATFSLCAAALSTLNAIGRYDTPEIRRGLDYLERNFRNGISGAGWFYYGCFYAAQAFFNAQNPRYWGTYYARIRQELLCRQDREDGGFVIQAEEAPYGRVYATAMATLILQIPYGYLPIFQK